MPSCFKSRPIRGSPIDRLVHRLDVYRQKLQNHKVRYPWSHHQTRPRNPHTQDQSETQILPMGDVHLERETERAETSSSDNLCILQPSAMMTVPARGILKPCRSSHTVESMGMISSKSSRHITWGETQVEDIELIGYKPCRPEHAHTGSHEYGKKRILLQYAISSDIEYYERQLKSECLDANMSFDEAVEIYCDKTACPSSRTEVLNDMLANHLIRKDAVKLYRALCTILAYPNTSYFDRLQVHLDLARAETTGRKRAYHADFALELVQRAMDIPCGPKARNKIVNKALKVTDLPERLAEAHELLRDANRGVRVHVFWNRLAQGGEGQRLYMENSDYKEELKQPAEPVNKSRQELEQEQEEAAEETRALLRELARLSTQETDAFLRAARAI